MSLLRATHQTVVELVQVCVLERAILGVQAVRVDVAVVLHRVVLTVVLALVVALDVPVAVLVDVALLAEAGVVAVLAVVVLDVQVAVADVMVVVQVALDVLAVQVLVKVLAPAAIVLVILHAIMAVLAVVAVLVVVAVELLVLVLVRMDVFLDVLVVVVAPLDVSLLVQVDVVLTALDVLVVEAVVHHVLVTVQVGALRDVVVAVQDVQADVVDALDLVEEDVLGLAPGIVEIVEQDAKVVLIHVVPHAGVLVLADALQVVQDVRLLALLPVHQDAQAVVEVALPAALLAQETATHHVQMPVVQDVPQQHPVRALDAPEIVAQIATEVVRLLVQQLAVQRAYQTVQELVMVH